MSNVFQNPNTYTAECLAVLMNEMVFTKHVSRKYESKFGLAGGKIGDTFNIRRPARFTVSTGASLSTQDYTETSIPLVINDQSHVDTTFTTADLTLKMEEFSDRIIKPSMNQLAAQIDQNGFTTAMKSVGNMLGTSGVTPASVTIIFSCGQLLDEMSAPRDGERYLVLNPAANATVVGSMTGFFNDPRVISSQFRDAVFVDGTNTIGFKIGMSQNVQRHTVGTLGGTPLVDGASQGITTGWANTTTLLTKGWTASTATLTAGDVFTIAGVNAVNPVTRQSTGSLQTFTVTALATSTSGGAMSPIISPAIISAGPFQNVSAAPADSAALTVKGTASTAYPRNLAWHRDAFTLGCIDMEEVSSVGAWGARKNYEGLSLRVAKQYLIASDTVPCRVDILTGWATPYPELAVQLVG